jgi:hypothetical protein
VKKLMRNHPSYRSKQERPGDATKRFCMLCCIVQNVEASTWTQLLMHVNARFCKFEFFWKYILFWKENIFDKKWINVLVFTRCTCDVDNFLTIFFFFLPCLLVVATNIMVQILIYAVPTSLLIAPGLRTIQFLFK